MSHHKVLDALISHPDCGSFKMFSGIIFPRGVQIPSYTGSIFDIAHLRCCQRAWRRPNGPRTVKYNREKQLPSSRTGVCRTSANAGIFSDPEFVAFETLPIREDIWTATSTDYTSKCSSRTTRRGQEEIPTINPDSNRRPYASRSRNAKSEIEPGPSRRPCSPSWLATIAGDLSATMSNSPTSSTSQAVDHQRLRGRLGFSSNVTREDALSSIWAEAVAECQHTIGADLLQSGFGSQEAVVAYIKRREEAEDALQKDHWHKMRARIVPLARVLEKLCAPIGDTLGSTASTGAMPSRGGVLMRPITGLPPKQDHLLCGGLDPQLVHACVKTHEELAQVGTALDEIKMHLRVVEAVVGSQPGDLLRDASVKLLAQIVSVLAAIVKVTREGRLRLWLQSLVDVRPLSSALQDLGRLATRHHEAIVGVTFEKVTQVMSSIAEGKVAQDWVNQRLLDLLQVAREVQGTLQNLLFLWLYTDYQTTDNTSLTNEEIAANRAILRRVELLFYRQAEDLREIKGGQTRSSIAEFDKVAQWLKYPDPSFKLSRLLDDRAEGTGSWFLDGDVFNDFRQGKARSVLLSGKAGSGKSTMIAAAAQALQAYCASSVPESLVIIHLFDATNGASAQDLHSLLSALLYQVALKSPTCASTISESRQKAAESGYTTKFDKERLLMGLLRSLSQCTFIVIDALDEADEADVLPFLERLRDIPTVSLLASRRTVTGAGTFDVVISIDDNDTDGDIGTVLDIAMSAGGALERIKDRDGVRQTLLAGAEGNFRWTVLVIQELRSIAGMPGKVRQRLKSLPESLEALYKACLDSISPADREDVRRLLLWLT
ncbi:uncharacterized protein SCHCODRAFT_02674819 [Schizophyllum commune H4-8]|uniref:NACHT domain-containing protein n=1 Tax=Schizophyllum commune (strain H4-8 / FGSC 9210) TaxID=578458 RepID=D8PVE5_SCHCM|nr:uncharacterized protein SCHCODRAFT_02674819 [Schizophyllum commune H4-8]KAI5900386.1 hypothetical protein SCHCODRAFT_02674819 [Schizophyllum commune H4-8]